MAPATHGEQNIKTLDLREPDAEECRKVAISSTRTTSVTTDYCFDTRWTSEPLSYEGCGRVLLTRLTCYRCGVRSQMYWVYKIPGWIREHSVNSAQRRTTAMAYLKASVWSVNSSVHQVKVKVEIRLNIWVAIRLNTWVVIRLNTWVAIRLNTWVCITKEWQSG